ncbi:MAG: winged helix-turn-helix transcriptional regulator [Lachnospiraceae bacterium]|nr:winged helix-turn-helix transcriptional regulator [Lachnospiraceae bacterium]
MKEGTEAGIDEVTIMHGWIMGYLEHNTHRDIYQKTIEADFSMGKSTVTSIVKLMEQKGYIRREAVPGDARLKKIVLTEEGKQMSTLCKSTLDQIDTSMLQGIPSEEIDIFFSVADRIHRNLEHGMEA